MIHSMIRTLPLMLTLLLLPAEPVLGATLGAWNSCDDQLFLEGHTLTRLSDGSVLVVGGRDETGQFSGVFRLFIQSTGCNLIPQNPLPTPRADHAAAHIVSTNGRELVVIFGGVGASGNPMGSVEIYEVTTGNWAVHSASIASRSHHTATTLSGDRFLIAGGHGAGATFLESTEIFDLSMGSSPTQSLGLPRAGHKAFTLANGDVLITGGTGAGGALEFGEVFDASSLTGIWMPGPFLATARQQAAVAFDPVAQLLIVAGGRNTLGSPLATVETFVYDPPTSSWTPFSGGTLRLPRTGATAVFLPSGRLLITGGDDSSCGATAEVFDPLLGESIFATAPSNALVAHRALALNNGEVLIWGGLPEQPLAPLSPQLMAQRFTESSVPAPIRTLVLTHTTRFGIAGSPEHWACIERLASDATVAGEALDLAPLLPSDVYDEWDLASTAVANVEEANLVLRTFHNVVRSLLATRPDVRFLQLLGGDSVIPMARIPDETPLVRESQYLTTLTGSSLPAGPLRDALEREHYPSDALLGTAEIPPNLESLTVLAGIVVGRLPADFGQTLEAIRRYLAHGGRLDLTELERKALVYGYDIVEDSARRACQQFEEAFTGSTICNPDALIPVDGALIDTPWPNAGPMTPEEQLLDHLGGLGAGPFGIVSAHEHADHRSLGVPGTTQYDIQGLDVSAFADLDLDGALVYGIGCHGGLAVPDTPNLPETVLGNGALAYLSNTGFGYVHQEGLGLSEGLVDRFTEELLRCGEQVLGDVLFEARQRQFLEAIEFGPYARQTLNQWSLYGFVNLHVRTQACGTSPNNSFASRGPGPFPGDQEYDGVQVSSEILPQDPGRPLRAAVELDLTGGTLRQYDPQGFEIPSRNCPGGRCYTTLNGRSTDGVDRPIVPAFSFETTLDQFEPRGALWLGGTFSTEDVESLLGKVASNTPEYEFNLGTLPRSSPQPPRSSSTLQTGGSPRVGSLLGTFPETPEGRVTVAAGEPVHTAEGPWKRHRIYDTVDLEGLYLPLGDPNLADTTPPVVSGDCDEFYSVDRNGTIHWQWTSTGETPWRVVVVSNADPTASGSGAWIPHELEDPEQDGTFELFYTPSSSEIDFTVQAVDNAGNVGWLLFEVDPPHGVTLRAPQVCTVTVPNLNQIFVDGFESGDLTAWTLTVP